MRLVRSFLTSIYLKPQRPAFKGCYARQTQHIKKHPFASPYRKSLNGLPRGKALSIADRYERTRHAFHVLTQQNSEGSKFAPRKKRDLRCRQGRIRRKV
ncbi:DNA-binding domain-containing protein [Pseudomonas putida]